MSKTKEVVEQVPAGLEFAVGKLESYFGAAQEVITKYGGDAIELGLLVLRLDAGQWIFLGLLLLIISLYLRKYAKGLYLTAVEVRDEYNKDREQGYSKHDISDSPTFFPFVLLTITSVVLTVGACINLFNLWNWVGVFYPEAYAVHKFLL